MFTARMQIWHAPLKQHVKSLGTRYSLAELEGLVQRLRTRAAGLDAWESEVRAMLGRMRRSADHEGGPLKVRAWWAYASYAHMSHLLTTTHLHTYFSTCMHTARENGP